MPRFVVAPAARQDIAAILAWTQEHFGDSARRRYEALLVRAIAEAAREPDLPGSTARPEIANAVRTYHLLYSRNRVTSRTERVNRPRHFLLYRIRPDGTVEIGRVLHDSMDVVRHVPDEFGR